jgi:hypothetical protein
VTVTAAAAAAAKGSALATNDVLEVFDIPAESQVLGCLAEVTTVDSGTTVTVDIGLTTVGADIFVDGAAVAGSVGYLAAGTNGTQNLNNGVLTSVADTLDILLVAVTAGGDDWVMRLFITLQDVSGLPVADSA